MVRGAHDPREFSELRNSDRAALDSLDDVDVTVRKQISLFVALDDYLLIREEAARRKTPMGRLVMRWIGPELDKIRKRRRRKGKS